MVRVFLLALLLPLVAMSHPFIPGPIPFDCQDVYQNVSKHNGVYTIYPTTADQPVSVYCDMGYTEDDADESQEGQWTVILKRLDGSVNFYKAWDEYKEGFGNKDGEYWLGLETLYRLTWAAKYELRVDMEDFEGGSVFAQYTSFTVASEDDGYRLRLGGYGADGGAHDSLSRVHHQKFSTYDKDQDVWNGGNCAELHAGGFWFQSCSYTNPTGLYRKPHSEQGVYWYHWKNKHEPLKTITMKIRRVTPPE